MTVTESEMPDEGRDFALDLIRDLSSVAGDYEAVCAKLRAFGGRHGTRGRDIAVLALVLTFAECMTTPTQPGDQAPVNTPIH